MAKFKFFQSIVYLSILSIITTLIWYYNLEHIGMPVFALIALGILIFDKNGMSVIPFFLNMMFMVSQTEWSLELIPQYLYLLPFIAIPGFIIHIIRFKQGFFKGKLAIPLTLLFLTMLLSSINVIEINLNYLFYISIGLVYLLVYFFFVSSIKGDNLKFLIKLFVVTGVMTSVQVLLYYIRVDDIANALENKTIDLGWGISNFIATYLIIFISSMFYFMKKYKFHVFWVLLGFFEIIMLLFTLSRGGISAFLVTLVFLMIYLYYGYEHKLRMTFNILLGLVLVVGFVYIRIDYFTTIWLRLTDSFFDDSGRFDLWIEAWNNFVKYPILGAGVFARVEGDYFGFYHNTILHTMGTLGSLGLISIIWQGVLVLLIFLKKLNLEKAILLIALIGANIHGMVDNVYYMPQFMVLFFIIIAAVENYNKENLEEAI
jgi:O-antigen ligase